MKSRFLICSLLTVGIFLSCNKIPDKSIFTTLSADELSAIIKSEPDFADFYEELTEELEDFNELEKAKFMDITYRGMYKMYNYMEDTTVWRPLKQKWSDEWNEKYGSYDAKVDSVLNYWIEYKESHSLNRFVQISFAEIDKEYYSYSGDVRNVNLGFKLKPLRGTVEQVTFRYRYSAKINKYFGDWNRCISTSPFSREVTRYWEVGYSDENRLKNLTTSSFIRDYDIEIEVTSVRCNGINYSEDDIVIPSSVQKLFETDEEKYPYLYASRREDVISNILCKSYISLIGYIWQQKDAIIKEKYPREYSLIEYLDD